MKVDVDLLADAGGIYRTATYEAPPTVRVGTVGLVEFGNDYATRHYVGRVASLTPSYDGWCKPFRPVKGLAIRR